MPVSWRIIGSDKAIIFQIRNGYYHLIKRKHCYHIGTAFKRLVKQKNYIMDGLKILPDCLGCFVSGKINFFRNTSANLLSLVYLHICSWFFSFKLEVKGTQKVQSMFNFQVSKLLFSTDMTYSDYLVNLTHSDRNVIIPHNCH